MLSTHVQELVRFAEAKRYAEKMGFLAYVECSAKTGNGIQEVSMQRLNARRRKWVFLAYLECSAKTGNDIQEVSMQRSNAKRKR